MEAKNAVGDFYRQEFSLRTAEDTAEVIALDQTITVPAGTFNHCLETAETTALEPGSLEHKWYAPGVGNAFGRDLVSGEVLPLISVTGL